MTPRLLILMLYPLLFLSSATEAYQTRILARGLPSKAWNFKRSTMIVFMFFQVFGVVKNLMIPRIYNWIDCVYLIGVVLLLIGLNLFDYFLIQDNKHLRTKVKLSATKELASGDMPLDFWRREFREAVRSEIRTDLLNPVVNSEVEAISNGQ